MNKTILRALACVPLLPALTGCQNASDLHGATATERSLVRGVVAEASACDGAACSLKAVVHAQVCAGSQCAEADERGRFELDDLSASGATFTASPLPEEAHVAVAFTETAHGSDPSRNPVTGLGLEDASLSLALAPDFSGSLELASIHAAPQRSGTPEGSARESSAGVAVLGRVELSAEQRTLRIPLRRLPLPGETWTLRAKVSSCEACEERWVDLAGLAGTATASSALSSGAARAAAPAVLSVGLHSTPNTTSAGTSAIASKYAELGGSSGPLGAAVSPVQTTTNGLKRVYSGGTIYWTAATGAHAVRGAIHGRYLALGAENSSLGYPITDEWGTPDGIGRFNHFQNGAIYWTPETGVKTISGTIFAKWGELGWETGFLGYPTTDSQGTPDGVGVFSHFQGGAIYWTPSTGAHEVHGSILEKWSSMGWERSVLGYPVSDESATPDGVGRYSHFEGGSIYWAPSTGTHEVHGDIHGKWSSLGWELSELGYPVSDESGTPDGVGRYNHFENGSIYWTPSTGAHEVRGSIREKWSSLGWEQGLLGYPVTDEEGTPDGIGRYNHFQNGSIYWTPGTGAHEVHGEIRRRWSQWGWERSALGYPTSDEVAGSGGFRVGNFERGQIKFKIHESPLKVFTQNMAFLVFPASYKGMDCDMLWSTGEVNYCGAMDALIEFLKGAQPDVVGLQEMFNQAVVDYLLADPVIAAMYPHRRQGPDENVIAGIGGSDGGLLLLSRFPIVASDAIIYRKCGGEDCLAAKGVLYAQVEAAPGVRHDVFVTHTQNPNPDIIGSAVTELRAQLEMLGSFMHAKRGTQEFPAIIMGDLNVDALEPDQYAHLLQSLWNPVDTWPAANGNTLGITSDNNRFFYEGNVPYGPRGVSGKRIDYILVHQGQRFELPLQGVSIVAKTSPSGHDMSDHYGVLATFTNRANELNVVYTGPVAQVRARLRRFHGFEVTNGTLDWITPGDNNDELEWRIGLQIGSGSRSVANSARINDVGENRDFWWASPPTTSRGPMGSTVTVDVEGWEVDDACVAGVCVETGRASLRRQTLSFSREQLFEALHQPMLYSLGMMRGDGGEYMATVELTATR